MRAGSILCFISAPGRIWGFACYLAVLFLTGAVPCVMAQPVPVVVSILPEQFLAERVGGRHIQVSVMVGPGQSPETYEPSPAQMAALKAARVYFRIRVPFEAVWMSRMQSVNPKMTVVDVSEGIRLRPIDRIGGESGKETGPPDPHVWTDPPLAKLMAAHIRDTLIRLDPSHKADYGRNYTQLAAELDALDAEIRNRLSPVKQRAFMTFHPAWGYFADNYSLRQIPIESEGKEPGPRTLMQVVQEAKRLGIKVIFVEPQFSRSSATMVAREIGGRVVAIDPLSDDYLGNMRKVVAAFAAALEAK